VTDIVSAIDLSDDDLVAELVTHVSLAESPRVRELRHQILHRLKFRAGRLDVHEKLACECVEREYAEHLDLARANGALAARVEVMAVLAKLADAEQAGDDDSFLGGIVRALRAVAGMK
jgi:hypothetical protein